MLTQRADYGPWYGALDEAGRDRMRLVGRQLMALVTDAVARPRSRSARLSEARDIGTAYGREGLGSCLRLGEILPAFVFFRGSVEETARSLARREGISAPQALDLWQHIDSILDAVLLAAVAVYELAPPADAASLPS